MNIALISTSNKIPYETLLPVAEALDNQIQNDFGPVWNVKGRVLALPLSALGSLPNTMFVFIDDDGKIPAEYLTPNRLAFTVKADANWSIAASSAILNGLVNPLGNRTVKAGSAAQFLVTATTAVQGAYYKVGAFKVSDFVTPAYFRLPSRTKKLNHLDTLTDPFETPNGGHLLIRGTSGFVRWPFAPAPAPVAAPVAAPAPAPEPAAEPVEPPVELFISEGVEFSAITSEPVVKVETNDPAPWEPTEQVTPAPAADTTRRLVIRKRKD